MPGGRIKGLNKVRKRLADGSVRDFWYAWKGGPALRGEPGSPEFFASYEEARAAVRRSSDETLSGLVRRYRGSPEFQRLAARTKSEWSRWLDTIEAADIGSLTFTALEDKRVRGDLLEWRDQFAAHPRTADYAVQVLGRLLSYGVDRGHLERNALARATRLYRFDRSKVIWTSEEIAAFCAMASPELGRVLRLACSTGFRRADLIELTWADVGDLAIVKPTSKSRGRRLATVPLVPETEAVLAEIGPGENDEVVLRNTRGKAWTADGLECQFIKARTKAGVTKRLHDARGTFVTRLRLAGLSSDEIADVAGWKKADVEALLAIYVDRELVIRSLSERLRNKA